jgi:hypothetical protein
MHDHRDRKADGVGQDVALAAAYPRGPPACVVLTGFFIIFSDNIVEPVDVQQVMETGR